jgi:aminoglycoside phosphotransferase (APT) family kinase protein
MPSFDPTVVAERLLGRRALQVRRIKGGRNAEVWRVDTPESTYALKRYVRSDASDRLAKETAALRFLERHGVANVPLVVAADAESSVILLSWLAGEPVSEATEDDILACVAFITLLRDLARAPDAASLPDAKEPCGSVPVILAQIDARIAKLAALGGRDSTLCHFFDTQVGPRRRALADLQRQYPEGFPQKFKTLTTSDFCVHNALRDAAGRLSFLDFEYFGWDDPAKLAADFLLHPGMNLPDRLLSLYAVRMHALFGEETGFARRLAALLPAYRLRWALIMLNPILDAAGSSAQEGVDFAAIVRTQTERATRYMQMAPISACEEGKRYVD